MALLERVAASAIAVRTVACSPASQPPKEMLCAQCRPCWSLLRARRGVAGVREMRVEAMKARLAVLGRVMVVIAWIVELLVGKRSEVCLPILGLILYKDSSRLLFIFGRLEEL